MRKAYPYTVSNVNGFNRLLQDICWRFNCIYIDCFDKFLDGDYYDYNKFLYVDWHHLNRRGLTVLAECLKCVINNADRYPNYYCQFADVDGIPQYIHNFF